ncbi:hypothetical protein AN214_03187 [Pseudoalteromonas sp. P1-9]|uniref:hypothetical protein n=1 Tax=Pseudoalteromonas sp. P1-9 TaxID=1710354 RepID=UPI0006D5DC6A|nr:hypothetical protein [Pseudoalteromonas sp. P1-9]KPV94780.1 hypothetical protein AN214_03187 [Pseudoalteromonas sp. P1-9]
MKKFGLVTCILATIVGCNSESSNNGDKPPTTSGTASKIDETFFHQIKNAGQHQTPWQGYQFDKVGMYLIHAENKQVKNAYIVNAKETIQDAVALDNDYGIDVNQLNDMSVTAHDKLLEGNGLFDFYYKIKNHQYYLQSYSEQSVNISDMLITPAITLAYHEAFHIYQHNAFKQPAGRDQLDFDEFWKYPLDEEMVTLKVMLLALMSDLPNKMLNSEETLQFIKQYIVLTEEMMRIDSSRTGDASTGWVYKHSLGQELFEGSALYVDVMMSREVIASHKNKPFSLLNPLILDKEQYGYKQISSKKDKEQYFAFNMFYESGASIIWLLHQYGVDLKQLENGHYPYSIAKEIANISELDSYYLLRDLKQTALWQQAAQSAKRYGKFN